MSSGHLISSIEAYSEITVLCVGDVMLDHFVYGTAGRISPEAPIPVVSVEHEESMLGGAGNVVRNLLALGASVIFVTATGDDPAGRSVAELLQASPRCLPYIVRDARRRTSVKTRYLAHNQQLLRVDAESVAPLHEEVLNALAQQFEVFLPQADIVIASDYAKGVLSGYHIRRFIDAAAAAGKPIYVDPKGHDFRRYRGATLVKPNLKEMTEASQLPVHDDAGVERAARFLLEDAGVRSLLVTRGAAGMMLVQVEREAVTFRSRARQVFDVSGAGDTVAATLALGTAVGLSLEEAVEVSCVAAGVVVGKVGTATLTPKELLWELENTESHPAGAKIFAAGDAPQRVRFWRRMGLRIGFTSGAFAALTPGDVTLLSRAKEGCDKLIVGVAGDSRSRQRKTGMDERGRSLILASLASVDLVVIFDEGDVDPLIRSLRPDVVTEAISDSGVSP